MPYSKNNNTQKGTSTIFLKNGKEVRMTKSRTSNEVLGSASVHLLEEMIHDGENNLGNAFRICKMPIKTELKVFPKFPLEGFYLKWDVSESYLNWILFKIIQIESYSNSIYGICLLLYLQLIECSIIYDQSIIFLILIQVIIAYPLQLCHFFGFCTFFFLVINLSKNVPPSDSCFRVCLNN